MTTPKASKEIWETKKPMYTNTLSTGYLENPRRTWEIHGVLGNQIGMHCIKASSLRLRISTELCEFEDFWPSNDRLGRSQCYVFQCADFLKVWCDTIGHARRTTPFFVAALNNQDRALALFPFGIETRSGVRILTFLDGGVCDYNSPVVFPENGELDSAALQEMFDSLKRILPRFDIVVLEKMPNTIHTVCNPLTRLRVTKYRESGY